MDYLICGFILLLSGVILWLHIKNKRDRVAIQESSQKLTDLIREKDHIEKVFNLQKQHSESWATECQKLKKEITDLRTLIDVLQEGARKKEQERVIEIPKQRQDAVNKARSILKGKITEEITPLLPDFPYAFGDCKFSGAPLDFVVYKGMSQGNVEEIIFLDVKTGEAKLNQVQRQIRKCVLDKKVKFVTFTPEVFSKKE